MGTVGNLELLEARGAEEVVNSVLTQGGAAQTCFTCSFQAEDIVVLHLLRKHVANIPVLFLETGYHFAEIYQFADQRARERKLNIVNVVPNKTVPEQGSARVILT